MSARDDHPQPQAAWFIRPNGFNAAPTIHGLSHTRRVLVHAIAIAEALGLEGWQRAALELAVCWHDIGRTNDGLDFHHGEKSAAKVIALGLHEGVDPLVREVALFVVRHHCRDERHAEKAVRGLLYPEDAGGDRGVDVDAVLRVFYVLKDADGLDRVRIGDLNPAYLRTDPARGMVQRAWDLLREMP
jgi:hypothetical protein